MTPLTEKQKFNLKALGLGVYLYILAWFSIFLLGALLGGGDSLFILIRISKSIIADITKSTFLFIFIQLILFLIARRILKKNPPKSVLKFIYASLIILAAILIITTFFPLPGIDFRFVG